MTLEACAALVKRGDPDRFLAVMAAPMAARARLMPLYAFNLEVARAPWVTKEPMIAEMRLQWWRDVVAEPAARAHEVADPLHRLIGEANLPVGLFDRLIAARRWDVYRDGFADRAAFDAYLEDTGAGLMWLAALALGAAPEAEAAVRAYGWASALAGFLRAVPELEARGRLPLVDGRAEAVRALAQEGLDRVAMARRARRQIGPAVPALLAGWQAVPLLRRAAAQPMRVAGGRMGLSDFTRKGRLVWQAFSGRY